jgi:nucleoside-diphosphate-sugar epimerase
VPVSCAREGRFCWIDSGLGTANVVYVDNLVDAMIRAAVTPAAHGQRFIINDECLPWREFLQPLLGPWASTVPSPDAAEFARLSTPAHGPGIRDIARSIVHSTDVWNTVTRTALANRLRPFVKKRLPGIARLRPYRTHTRPTSRPNDPPPSWLAEVYGPATTRFSSEQARTVLGWQSPISRERATEQTIAWLRRHGFYEAPRP